MQSMLTTFGHLRERGASFQLAGLVATMLAQEVPEVADVYNQLRQEMPEGLLLETSIPRDPLFFQASLWGIPLGLFEPLPALAGTFDHLATELEPRLGLPTRPSRPNYGPLLD
jgi:cellulose biosynthesis protein BcsQ